MLFRFFIFFFTIFYSINSFAIKAEDIKLTIEPFSTLAMSKGPMVNNFTLQLKLPEGWHTYYKNGGDAAKGASLKFDNLPTEITTSELFYTTPIKKVEQGFASYIYEDIALMGFSLLREDKSKQESTVKTLNTDGHLEFLVCKDICKPITKEFNINQTFKYGFKPNVKYFELTQNFAPAQDALFAINKNNLFIKLDNNIESATFIPDEDGFINDSAEQIIVKVEENSFLKVELDEYLEKYPEKFTGLIKTNTTDYKVNAKSADLDVLTTQEKIMQFAIIALFALIGGIILNLMPCVLPVIGLKVFALLKHTSSLERIKGALSYTAGVFVCMMIVVGLLVLLKTLGNELAWGFQLQNKYFIGFMIGLLMLIGLNLLGIFEVGNLISSKASKLNMKYSNDFFTGVLTTLVATPCTAPFMATSLGFALTSDSHTVTFIIFAFLALGICLPILLIAALPKTHKLLPKPGGWSERLKQFLAFPIFATVIWLVWVLDSGSYVITLCLSGVFIASFIGWNLTLKSKIKHLIIIVILTLSILAIYKHMNKPEPALEFNKSLITELNNQGKNVFIDFTAKWCLTCQYNKKYVLDLTSTRRLLHKHNTELMIADWTNKNNTITQEIEKLERSGVPVYAIYPANGSSPILLPEILTQNTVKKYLERL